MIVISCSPHLFVLKTIAAAIFFLSLIGCATHSPSIGYSVTPCCVEELASTDFTQLATYKITTDNIPTFLNSMVIEEFEKAFQEKGFQPGDNNSGIIITLSYLHTNLDREQSHIDPLIPHESMNIELHYSAAIIVDIKNSINKTQLWSGKINKNHRVSPGEYMHDNNARGAFLIAFRNLLKEFPSR